MLPSSAQTLPPGSDAVRPGRRDESVDAARRDRVERRLGADRVALVARVVHDERRCRGTPPRQDRCRAAKRPRPTRRAPARRGPCARRRSAGRAPATRSRNGVPISASSRNQPPVGDAAVGGPASVYTFHADGRSVARPLPHPVELGRTEVRMHDRVGEHAPGPRVAVGHVADRGDLRVLEHVLAGRARRRGEQRDRGLARAEHERGPRGRVDRVRVDGVRPALGIHHPEEVPERGGVRSVPQDGVDEMGLHVDHRTAGRGTPRRPRPDRAPRPRRRRRSRRRARRRSPAGSSAVARRSWA